MADAELKVEYVDTSVLVPYANNAKEHPQEQIREIANSMEEFGNCDPIAVWTNPDGKLEIVEGHGRLLALNMLGIDRAPIIKLDHLTDEQRRAYTHIHNQTTLTSGFDLDILKRDMESLNFDWDSFGFEGIIVKEFGEDIESVREDDFDIEQDVESRCKQGDIWLLGEHRLMCGDSTDAEDMKRLMGGETAKLLLTDPPYNVEDHAKAGSIKNDSFQQEGAFRSFLRDALSTASGVMGKGAAFYIWFASTHSPAVYGAVADAKLSAKQELEWVKSSFTLGRQDYQWAHEACVYGWKEGAEHYFVPARNEWTVIDDAMDTRRMSKNELKEALENILENGIEKTILRYAKPSSNELHPTMKPIKLFARLMRNSSRQGDSVLDSFGGSGTTMMAAEQLGRRAYIMELDPRYCDVIIARWEEFTGREAKRLQ